MAAMNAPSDSTDAPVVVKEEGLCIGATCVEESKKRKMGDSGLQAVSYPSQHAQERKTVGIGC